MLVLPEIQIEKALKKGFANVADNIDLLDDLFANYPPEMVAEAKKWLTTKKVEIIQGWPKSGQNTPRIAIVNSGDPEDPNNDTLGDYLATLFPEDNEDENLDVYGIAKRGTYTLICQGWDPRLTLYISFFAETLLVLHKMTFEEAGMTNLLISSSDLRFEEGMLPEWENSRVVTLSCLHYHAFAVSEPIVKAFVSSLTPEVS